ncbi:uncharacterized protein PHA67_019099 isoform 1-T1 [Liasis olivaceus]
MERVGKGVQKQRRGKAMGAMWRRASMDGPLKRRRHSGREFRNGTRRGAKQDAAIDHPGKERQGVGRCPPAPLQPWIMNSHGSRPDAQRICQIPSLAFVELAGVKLSRTDSFPGDGEKKMGTEFGKDRREVLLKQGSGRRATQKDAEKGGRGKKRDRGNSTINAVKI